MSARTARLEKILRRLNHIHLIRRLAGRSTAHLYHRCRYLSQAYLDSLES